MRRWVTVVSVVLLVLGGAVAVLHTRGGGAADPGRPRAVTPGAGRVVLPLGEIAAGFPEKELYSGPVSLSWLPPGVGAPDDSGGTANLPGRPVDRDALLGNGGGATSATFRTADGRGGVLVELLMTEGGPADLRLADGGPVTYLPTTVHGAPAMLIRSPGARRLYLAWSWDRWLVAVGVTAPRFGQRDLYRVAEGVRYAGEEPAVQPDAPGNRTAADAVRTAYRTAFALDTARTLTAVDGGADLEPTRRRLPPVTIGTAALDVTGVTFTGPTRAEVTGTLSYVDAHDTNTPLAINGSAVRTRTGWKLTRASFCSVLARLGARCPA